MTKQSKQTTMSLSLDLDNKWSYMKTYGSDSWKDYPSYFDIVVPRILNFLHDRELRITFFIVGQDAALEKNHAALRQISDAGHEIASHSFNHDPWLHLYDDQQLNDELASAEIAIKRATGESVSGFRGPGFSLSEPTLRILNERGYAYDATAFPNILNPMARAYFFAKSNLSAEEKERRKALFGSFSDAFRPVKPYKWTIGEDELLEVPVTTMPIFKVPIHFSYLIYLGTFSEFLAKMYLRIAIAMCKMTRTEPSLLLHPLDFLSTEDDAELAFFPGMNMTTARKLSLMGEFFRILQPKFQSATMGEHVEQLKRKPSMRKYVPEFRH